MAFKKVFFENDTLNTNQLEYYLNDDGELYVGMYEGETNIGGHIVLNKKSVQELIKDLSNIESQME